MPESLDPPVVHVPPEPGDDDAYRAGYYVGTLQRLMQVLGADRARLPRLCV